MLKLTRGAFCALLFGTTVVLLGCAKEKEKFEPAKKPEGASYSSQTQPDSTKTADPFGDGKSVFEAQDCKKCHEVDAGAAAGKKVNLSKAGKDHDAAWLIAQVKNPKSHKPESKMPAFADKISDKDYKSLGDYLASLK